MDMTAEQEPASPGRPDPAGSGGGPVAGGGPAYLAEELREVLATASGVHEQGITVEVRGDQVRLSGSVATSDQRDAIAGLVGERAEGYVVVNAVRVVSMAPPAEVEDL